MEQTTKPFVVGVKFSKVGKIYHFAANDITDVKVGDMVVVETSRGWQLGTVSLVVEDAEPPPDGWKSIDRRATPRDLLLRQMWQMKESDVVSTCRARSTELKLNGIKIVSAEYSFDGSRLTILFSTETEEKYELKSLRQDMQKAFAPSQVELRQVGPRDVAKTHCGMGACGLETRCCCLFLTEFSSISIRMAKEQGISLTPSEITGMCGRLRCCLIYEYDTYVDARSKLPKRNKRVRTPQGEGKVVEVIPLRSAVIVDIPEVGHKEFPGAEVSLLDDGSNPVNEGASKGSRQAADIDQAVAEVPAENVEVKPSISPERPVERKLASQEQGQRGARRFSQGGQQRGNRGSGQKGPNVPETKAGTPQEKGPQQGPRRKPDPKWKKKQADPSLPSMPTPPSQPKAQPGGSNQPQNRRNNRRKKGPRRDTPDNNQA